MPGSRDGMTNLLALSSFPPRLLSRKKSRLMVANPALQPTANPLRGLSAAELGRYAVT